MTDEFSFFTGTDKLSEIEKTWLERCGHMAMRSQEQRKRDSS